MDLINALDPNSKDYDIFLQDLLSVNDDLPSDIDEVDNLHTAIISHINSRINQSSTRHDGLKILTHVLPRCSKELLSKYAILWISKASQTLENSQSSAEEITLACRVLGSTIIRCKDVPELQKTISMQTIKQLVIMISNLETERQSGAVLYLLATILYHYKEPSERLQTSIRKMILPLIDINQKNLVQAGANCYTLLTRATERSFKPPASKPFYTAWTYDQALLCNSLHSIMDDLFAGLIELENNDVWEKLDLPNIPEDNVIEYYRSLERRFDNLCVYLSTMLRGCSGKISVCPKDVMQILCRGLAVTPSSLRSEDSFKKQMLHFVLPKLHMSLLAVLNALIKGFQKQLIPHAITILQLYQQTLKWTEKIGDGKITVSGGKPFKRVRIAVYESLKTWLSCLGTLSGIDIVADDFLPHFLKDISPERERVLLTVQKTQHLSKRALKRYKDNQYENSASLGNANVAKKDPCTNAELCKNALETLESVFVNAACSLKQSFYKATQDLLIPLLYDYYLGNREENFYDSDKTCRLRLLRALKAINFYPHPSTPPPTQYSIEIFSMALRDIDPRIVEEAKFATAELEKIVHPSAPTLQLPSRIEESVDKELGIRWSRPPLEHETVRNNTVFEIENNVWERFRETRDEITTTEQSHRKSASSEETRDSIKTSAAAREASELLDGPTPSKQQKLRCNDPGERMDTSEDEISISSPQNGDKMINDKAVYESPQKKAIVESARKDNSCKNGELATSQTQEASYLTLKEFQGNEDGSCDVIEVPQNNSANDNERTKDTQLPNRDISQELNAAESARQVEKSLDDNSEDEVMISLFCDELKDP